MPRVQAPIPLLPGICSDASRFGVGVTSWIGFYEVEQLHAGWYTSFTWLLYPPEPGGMQFIQTIRLSDDGPFSDRACSACPPWTTVASVVRANPGSLWLIGSEPDAVAQDYVYPDRYAALYHAFYTFLKSHDPTGRVGVAAVVQTTPVRRQYLDLILDSYQAQFGAPMPVDVWNIHNYVLREKRPYPGCPDCWGCGVPPGVPQDVGILYDRENHNQLDPDPWDPSRVGWKRHITDFRQWMKDRGQQDKPLIITEFGILMWVEYGFPYDPVVHDFMQATFDFLMTATDPDTGYPADDYRLVQAWAWYSLDQKVFNGGVVANNLFDPDTRAITPLGLDFAAYTEPLTRADLAVTQLDLSPPLTGALGVTVTLTIEVRNDGDRAAGPSVLRLSCPSISEDLPLPGLDPNQDHVVERTWHNLPLQQNQVLAQVDPDQQVAECNEQNNSAVRYLCASCNQALSLPLMLRLR